MQRVDLFLSKSRVSLLIILLYLVLPYLFFWKLFFLPEISRRFFGSDFVGYFGAFYYSAQRLLSGDLPLWDPHMFMGAPYFAKMDLGILYPFHLLAVLIIGVFRLDIPQSYYLFEGYVLFHLSLAGIFTYFLARDLKISRISAFLSGLVFMFSGALVDMANAVPLITTIAWVPLTLVLYKRYIEDSHQRGRLSLFILVGVVFMSHLAGYIQHTLFYNFLFLFIYLIFHLLVTKSLTIKRLITEGCILFLTFISSLVMYSVQLIPALELLFLSNRSSMTYAESSISGAMRPLNLFDLLVPQLFSFLKNYSILEYQHSYVYFGIFSIFLVLFAIFSTKTAVKYFLVITFFLFLMAAMGGFIAVYDFLYWLVPGISKFRNVAKFLYLSSLSWSLLSGLGLDVLIDKADVRRNVVKAVSIVVILVCAAFFSGGVIAQIYAYELVASTSPLIKLPVDTLNTVAIFGLFSLISFMLVYFITKSKDPLHVLLLSLVFVFIDLNTYNMKVGANNTVINPRYYLSQSGVGFLNFLRNDGSWYRVQFYDDPHPAYYVPGLYRLFNSEGYSSFVPAFANRLILERNRDPQKYAEYLSKMGVKYLISSDSVDIPNLEKVFEDPVTPENQRFYFKYAGRAGIVYREVGEVVRVYENKLFTPIITFDGTYDVIEFSADKLVLSINSSKGGELALKVPYYPGWVAYLDSSQVSILREDGFMSVSTPAGKHTLAISFEPPSFYFGLLVSLVSIGVYIYLLVDRVKNILKRSLPQ